MRSSFSKYALLASVAFASAASAQTASSTDAKPAIATAPSQTADAPAAIPGDIVVTGTRRATNLHDAPISISAISGDKMAQLGFKSAQELQYAVPGLSYNRPLTKSASPDSM